VVSPISAASDGYLSDGTHIPLAIASRGLLIFTFIPPPPPPVSRGSHSLSQPPIGGGPVHFGESKLPQFNEQEELEEEEIIFGVIQAFLHGAG